jgi:hypothetical protein
MKELKDLLKVKTLVTLILTIVFGIVVLWGLPIPSVFEEIYKIVVIFYFGTQVGKAEAKATDTEGKG